MLTPQARAGTGAQCRRSTQGSSAAHRSDRGERHAHIVEQSASVASEGHLDARKREEGLKGLIPRLGALEQHLEAKGESRECDSNAHGKPVQELAAAHSKMATHLARVALQAQHTEDELETPAAQFGAVFACRGLLESSSIRVG